MSVKTTGFQTVEVGMYIDKKKVVKIEHTDYGKFKSGYIGFQDHGSDLWFKNVKIKKL